MSVVHGGCGFPFLSKAVYEYLSCGKYTSIDVHLEDIPDPTLRFAIQKVFSYIICCLTLNKNLVGYGS